MPGPNRDPPYLPGPMLGPDSTYGRPGPIFGAPAYLSSYYILGLIYIEEPPKF